jgi:hypothetical protein
MLVVLSLIGCNRFGELEEGDRNTYTWKGKLVKDCNGEPVANTAIFLEAGGPVDTYEDWEEIVASASTDEHGFFSLTYKHVRRHSYPNIELRTENRSLLGAPINQNIQRDVAMKTCYKVYVEMNNASGVDSVYFQLGRMQNYNNVLGVFIEEIDTIHQYPVIPLNLKGGDFQYEFHVIPTVGIPWDNKPRTAHYGVAPSLAEAKRSILSNLVDSIPDKYLIYPFEVRGFPYTDSLIIDL